MSLIPELPDFDPVKDLLRVKVTYTTAEGNSDPKREPFKRSLTIMANSVRATARQIWVEAGRPPHCHIEVEIARSVGEYTVNDQGELQSLHG